MTEMIAVPDESMLASSVVRFFLKPVVEADFRTAHIKAGPVPPHCVRGIALYKSN